LVAFVKTFGGVSDSIGVPKTKSPGAEGEALPDGLRLGEADADVDDDGETDFEGELDVEEEGERDAEGEREAEGETELAIFAYCIRLCITSVSQPGISLILPSVKLTAVDLSLKSSILR